MASHASANPVTETAPPPADPAVATAAAQRAAPLAFGRFVFDRRTRLLTRDGTELPLPPRVLGVLELLLERAGDVVPRQELIDRVWKDAFVTDTSLAEAISVLRQTLGDDSQAPTYVQTLHRRGYRFVAAVAAVQADAVDTGARAGPSPLADEAVSPSIGRELVPWSMAVICACMAAVAVWQLTRPRSEPAVATRFSMAAAAGTAFDHRAPALAVSPDGSRLAWSACDGDRCRLYVRDVDRLDALPLPGVEGRAPFFSPDGRWLGYFAGGRLMKASLSGGAPVTIADAPTVLGAVWTGRDIVFAGSPSGGLQRVSEEGGEVRPLTSPRERSGEIRHAWPALVPGTRVLIFSVDTNLPASDAGAAGLLAALSLDAVDSAGRSRGWQTLLSGVSIARAAASDAIVFARGADLHGAGFDPVRIALSGTPRGIASSVATAAGRAQFALSPAGTLMYLQAGTDAGRGAVVLDKTGQGSRREWLYDDAVLSPDGTRVAGVRIEEKRSEIWIADAARGAATRLTHTDTSTAPIWSADGRTVYFAARSDGAFELWRREADGATPAARLQPSTRNAFPLAASPDGGYLAFLQTGDRTGADIWLLPLAGGAARPLVEGAFDEGAASFSPDSAMLAFESAESGTWQVYVQRLGDNRRVLVSADGGRRPLWRSDGLYFEAGRTLMRAAIDGADLRVQSLSPVTPDLGGDLLGFGADGRLLTRLAPKAAASHAVVTAGWLRELRTLLGPAVAEPPR